MLATAVTVISLIVQGLTLEPLARLDELAAGECAADDVIDRARSSLQARIGHTRARIGGTRPPEPAGLGDRELRRDLNAAEILAGE